MAVQVKLKDIIEGLEFLTDEGSSYLNMTTGEVVYVTTEELRAAEEDEPLEDFPEWQHDAIRIARDIVETEHYLPLPDRFEINEYQIMERFCLSVDDEDMRDEALIMASATPADDVPGRSTYTTEELGV